MKNTLYKFYLSVDNGVTKREILPVYKGDLAMDYELESGQLFHRAKLSGKIDIVGDDYDWIVAQPFDSTYHFYITISHDNGATYSDYWHGTFVRTDCEVDMDNKKIVVQPSVFDQYTDLLNGWEREYDLIRDLNPDRTAIETTKQGYWQLYTPENAQACNIYDNDAVTEDVENELGDNQLDANNNIYAFKLAQQCVHIRLTKQADNQGDLPAVNCEGTYVGYLIQVPYDGSNVMYANAWCKCPTTNYSVQLYFVYDFSDPNHNTFTLYVNILDADGHILYNDTKPQWSGDGNPLFMENGQHILLAMYTGMVGRFVADVYTKNFYGRYVCASSEASITYRGVSVTLKDKPINNDLTITGLDYRRIFACGMNVYTEGNIFVSARTTTTANEWGNMNGVYWLPPTDDARYIPIYQREWTQGVSYWAIPLSGLSNKVGVRYTIPDTFPVSSVLASLLEKVSPSTTHLATSDYSEFLYEKTNPISGIDQTLYITPKSNAMVSDYSMAAQKGTITLKMVLDMLCKVFRAYWYIDSSKRLRIEHLKFFMQGKDYATDNWQVGVDLTTLKNTRNDKMWAFNKNSYTYDKSDMPERITFKWMDDVSEAFDGKPIILESPLVEQDKKEEQSISNFTSDLGYMLLNGTDVTKDGFALIGAWNKNTHNHEGRNIYVSSSYNGLMLYGDTDYWDFTLTAKVSASQAETIEYGLYDVDTNTFTKWGEIPVTTTPTEQTIVVHSEQKDYTLFFHSVGGTLCTMKLISVSGGQWAIPVVKVEETMQYPFTDNTPYHHAGTATGNAMILQITLPTYIQYIGNNSTSTMVSYRIRVDNVTNGTIQAPDGYEIATASTYTATDSVGSSGTAEVYFNLNDGETSGTYDVTIEALTYAGVFEAQILNYYLALEYVLPTYWAYGLPVAQASFNGNQAVTTSLPARNRQQNVKIPIGAASDPDTEKLVKTGVGFGQVGKLSVTLSSRVATTTLKHDTQ